MVDHEVDGSNLVVLHSNVNSRVISEHCNPSVIFLSNLSFAILVDDWELIVEIVFETLVKKRFYGVAIKSQDWNHVLSLQLKECWVEDLGVSLHLDKGEDIITVGAIEYRLKQEQLSNKHWLDLDLIDGLKYRLAILTSELVINLNDFIIVIALEWNVVLFVDLQVVARSQRMAVKTLVLVVSELLIKLLSLEVHYKHTIAL